jgi:hypothetical protein
MIDFDSIGDDLEDAAKEELDQNQELISSVFAAKVNGIAGKEIGGSDKSVFLYAGSVYAITSTSMSGAKILIKAKLRGNSVGELTFTLTRNEKGKFVITAIDTGRCYKVENSPVNTVRKFHGKVFVLGKKAEDASTAALVDDSFIDDAFKNINDLGEFKNYNEGVFKEISNDLSEATVETRFSLANDEGTEGCEVDVTYTLTFSEGKWLISDMEQTVKKFKANAENQEGQEAPSDAGEDDSEDE